MPSTREHISECMSKAASGDDEAFSSLAWAVQDDLYRFGLAFGLNTADAAEMTQEVLLRAYRGQKTWQAGTDALAWLYGIAMNVARELLRKHRKQRTLSMNLNILARPAQTPAEQSDRAKTHRQLTKALTDLPPRQAEAVTCRFLHQMSVADTASAMGCAEGTVKAAVFAGLKNLRKAMAKRI